MIDSKQHGIYKSNVNNTERDDEGREESPCFVG